LPGVDRLERSPQLRSRVAVRHNKVHPGAPEFRALLDVQRTAGNRAVVQLLERERSGASSSAPLEVQRWNPFKWFSSSSKSKKGGSGLPDDLSNLTVSGPRAGRPMGEKAPVKPPIMSTFDFEKDPRRRVIFAEWAKQQQQVEQIRSGVTAVQFDNSKMTDDILRVDYVLSPFQSLTPPSYQEAMSIVATLRSCSDPEVQRVVAESEAKYRPYGEIMKLEDAVASEQKYRQKHGGMQMIAGISGIIHYMGNDLYTMFYDTPGYAEAVGLPALPPVPSREGRPELGGDVVGTSPPPVPSRESRPPLSGSGAPGLNDVGPESTAPRGRVAELANQLGGVIGGVRPGGTPPPSSSSSSPVPGPEPVGRDPESGPVAKVVLAERQDPRATERKVLEAIERGEKVSPELLTRLAIKMGKGQTTSRGRDVTSTTEAEYFEIASKLSPEERSTLKAAANDYAQTSAQINKLARGQNLESDPKTIQHQIDNLDSVFSMLDQKGLTEKRRIVYRLATYQAGQPIPYGDKVKVGDVVGDKAYVSTSENRQLLQEGAVERKAGTRFVKFTIVGTGGANISGGGPYTNEMGKRGKKELGLKGPSTVGQAEILFRRGSLFRIESVTPVGEDIHVMATRVDASDLGGQSAKNAFNGDTLSLT
jgi:hypothetical protein